MEPRAGGKVQRRGRHSHTVPPPPVLCRSLKTLGMPVKITPRLLLKCQDLENLQILAASNSSFFPTDYDPMQSLQLCPDDGRRNCTHEPPVFCSFSMLTTWCCPAIANHPFPGHLLRASPLDYPGKRAPIFLVMLCLMDRCIPNNCPVLR